MIINNQDFVNEVQPTRIGSYVDVNNLDLLFSDDLRFTVTLRNNLSYLQMKEEILRFAGKEDHAEGDMTAVVVMSHGRDGAICTSEGRELETEWILKQFNNEGCPRLRGKPKLFIFQSCRGHAADPGVSATLTDSQEAPGTIRKPTGAPSMKPQEAHRMLQPSFSISHRRAVPGRPGVVSRSLDVTIS